MIDLSTPDTLLYDSAVLSSYIRKNTKESFGYIFFDNIDYITKLYNDNRMRDVTYKNILDTILCGLVLCQDQSWRNYDVTRLSW